MERWSSPRSTSLRRSTATSAARATWSRAAPTSLALGGTNTNFTGTITINAGRFRDVTGPENFGNPLRIEVNNGGQIYTYREGTYAFPLDRRQWRFRIGGRVSRRLASDAVWSGPITLAGGAVRHRLQFHRNNFRQHLRQRPTRLRLFRAR